MTPEEATRQQELTDRLMTSLHEIALVNTNDGKIVIAVGDETKTQDVAKDLFQYLEFTYRQRISILTEALKYQDSPSTREQLNKLKTLYNSLVSASPYQVTPSTEETPL